MWSVPALALLTGILARAASGHVHAAHHLSGGPADPADGLHAPYASYAERHGRSAAPGSREFEERKALYARRAALVAEHNGRPERLWNAGLNHLSDRTDEELAQLRGWRGAAGRGRGGKAGSAQVAFLATGRSVSLPQVFNNWTKLASLSSVRDQRTCGSCWAVAASVVLEAHAEIHDGASRKGRAQRFSTQELLDCVPNPHHCGGGGGCDGATVELALDWALNKGLAKESENPYKARDGRCRKSGGRGSAAALQLSDSTEDLTRVGVHFAKNQGSSFLASKTNGPRLTAWERLPENEAEPLARALVERGPVGVSVSADTWYMYAGGVFNSCGLDAVIDHAVTLIGLGVQKGHKYWLIQNSWGNGWGEGGRIKLLRRDDDNEQCGTDRQPEVGTGCTGGPAKVRVCGMCGVLYDSAVPHFGH